MTTKQISVFLENKPGSLGAFTKILDEHKIDMRAMCLADAQDFGILRLIVDDVYNTMAVLKDAGYVAQITKVVTIELEDKPGALVRILDCLASQGVNVEYTYAFLSRVKDRAYLVIKTADNDRAVELLREAGIRPVCQDDLAKVFE